MLAKFGVKFAILLGIIALGLCTRLLPLGWPLWDKYLGDALYAAMVYALLQLQWTATPARLAALSMAVMIALETFQLTLMPAHWLQSEHLLIRLAARLLGTQFSWLDLLAYAVGLLIIYLFAAHGPSRREVNAR